MRPEPPNRPPCRRGRSGRPRSPAGKQRRRIRISGIRRFCREIGIHTPTIDLCLAICETFRPSDLAFIRVEFQPQGRTRYSTGGCYLLNFLRGHGGLEEKLALLPARFRDEGLAERIRTFSSSLTPDFYPPDAPQPPKRVNVIYCGTRTAAIKEALEEAGYGDETRGAVEDFERRMESDFVEFIGLRVGPEGLTPRVKLYGQTLFELETWRSVAG